MSAVKKSIGETMTLSEKYEHALNTLPAPGGGGCHSALLGVANLGVMTGLTDGQMFSDLRNSIPSGIRKVPDKEITDAIRRARQDVQPIGGSGEYKPRKFTPPPAAKVKPGYLQHLIKQGAEFTEDDFRDASPVSLDSDPAQHALLLVETLYTPGDVLFMGERYNKQVKTAEEWAAQIDKTGTALLPHIIPNPVTGKQHPDKSGTLSFRCDNAVKDFRFAVVEFDDIPRQDQLAFWAAIPLSVAALIDSGGKSIHGWIAVNGINNADQWEQWVETGLYKQRLIPLGVDPSCRNEARLSRLPGHYRSENKKWQKLLYLNPKPTTAAINS